MTEEHEIRLEDLDDSELLARLEGGLFSLLEDNEEYSELFRVAAAIGIKHFVAERMRGYEHDDLLALFEDGELVIKQYIRFAADLGLFENEEQGRD